MKCPSLNLVTFLVLKSALPNVSVAPSAFLVVTPKLSGLLTGADGQAPLSPFSAHVPMSYFTNEHTLPGQVGVTRDTKPRPTGQPSGSDRTPLVGLPR